mgnify:CR=1 FL=1
MLYTQAVEPSTLDLLKDLQSKEYLKGFYLVGGTALALRIGHRKSIDIDLFSNFGFDALQVLEKLSFDYKFNLFFSATNTLKGSIDSVQVDIIAHRYPFVKEPELIENFSMLSVEDILAMKLNAIAVNGQRVKDFIDIYYLLQRYSLAEMVSFYQKKYALGNEVNILKSIIYFDDVDLTDWPILLEEPALKWSAVKKRIIQASLEYTKNL